jgi:hypothetical protein
MPQPPATYDLGKMNFIANYALLGCVPPMHLAVQFAKDPALDLALLFLLPDIQDIGQAIFEPKKGRRSKPGRHGRKKRRFKGLPDTSDLIGQGLRGRYNPNDALRLTKATYLFPILNIYEGAAFTAAVVEGVTDIGFQSLLGVMTVDPTHCREFARMLRQDDEPVTIGGAGPPVDPMVVENVTFESGFWSSSISCYDADFPYIVYFDCFVFNMSEDEPVECELALENLDTGAINRSSYVEIAPREGIKLSVAMRAKANDNVVWGLGRRNGFVLGLTRSVLAFREVAFPWPL